jgi:hypothetical protein
MKCHRKCCIYTTLGVFLVLSSAAVLYYLATCEHMYQQESDLCGQVNTPVCDICNQCTCTTVCTPADIALFCGDDCAAKGNDINDWECPHKYVGRTLIGVFVLFGGSIAIATVLYFLRETFQEITGTQDDY